MLPKENITNVPMVFPYVSAYDVGWDMENVIWKRINQLLLRFEFLEDGRVSTSPIKKSFFYFGIS